MNKLFVIIFLIVGFALCTSCTVEDTKGDGSYVQDNVNVLIHSKYLTPFYRVVDMADFFDRYQKSLEYGQAKADSLALLYFGDCLSDAQLDEEHFQSDEWGSIYMTDTVGEYTANALINWSSTGTGLRGNVSAKGNREYEISLDEQDNLIINPGKCTVSIRSEVSVTADECLLETLRMDYSETLNDGSSQQVTILGGTGSETIKLKLCKDGEYRSYPVGGTLYYTVTGDVTDSFSVVFYEYYYDVIFPDGASSSYLSF